MTIWNKLSFFLICTVIAVSTLLYGTVHQPVISLFYAAIVVLIIVWAMDGLVSGELRYSTSKLQLPLLLLAGYAVIQTIPFGSYADAAGLTGIPRTISVDPYSTQVTAAHMLMLAAFFGIMLVALQSAGRLRRMLTLLTAFGFLYAFYAILQGVLSPDTIYGLYKPRAGVPYGSFVNRNDFAAVMAMLVALPLGMIFTGTVRPEKRLLYLVAAGLMGTSLLLSGSRGGAVALVAEILLLIIISTRARGTKNLALKAALSLLLAASAVGGAVFVGGETSISRFADSAGAEDISSNRTHIWGVTLKVIGEHFPLGAGVGAYAQAYTKSDTASGFERIEQAHNDYLQVLADAGLPGLFIGALFLYWIFRQGRRSIAVENKFRRGVAVGAVAGIFGILVHSLFDFVLHITAISLLFLALMALLTASSRVYDDDVTDLEDERRQRRKASVTPMDRARIN